MRKFKKWLKLFIYAMLIILALVGMGIAGTPVPPQNKKEEEKIIEINTEKLVDEETAATEFNQNK